MRSIGITDAMSSRSGAVSSSARGGATHPPEKTDSSQLRLAPSTVSGSARTTCSSRKPSHTRTSSATASLMQCARAASAAAFSAPAEVPTSTSNGHGLPSGSHFAISLSTPT
jgi:hypothetical protein